MTRRDLLDLLTGVWHGRLSELDFLARLYDLEALPSQDRRYNNFAQDLRVHTVQFPGDWEDEWFWHDERLELYRDVKLLPFLAEVLHPLVRTSEQEAQELASKIDALIRRDGFKLQPGEYVSGLPVYAVVEDHEVVPVRLEPTRQAFLKHRREDMLRQIKRLERALSEDDIELAIGTSKELVESVCKTILDDAGVVAPSELPSLAKRAIDEVDVFPAGFSKAAGSDETVKRFRGGLVSVVHGLAELRNNHGTGHGRGSSMGDLELRHAKLAAGSATSIASFLFESWFDRESKKSDAT